MSSHCAGRRVQEPAKTYYYDFTNGNDSNSGTSEHLPLKTITNLNAKSLNPGDRVLFKRGETWQATPAAKNSASVRCPSSGTQGLPIYFGAYGTGAAPVFDQCVIYTDWTVYDDPTYSRPETGDADYGRQVFENGVRLIKTTSIANVKAIAGSWYGTGNVVYVHTTTGASPNGLNVGYPAEGGYPNGFDFYGKSWITVENIHVTRPKNHCFGLNTVNGSVGIVINNCTASWSGGRGFRFAPLTIDGAHQISKCAITNCITHDTAGEGIWAGGGEVLIEDNEIYNCKKDYASKNIGDAADVSGIVVGVWANGCVVRGNYIHDGYHNGLFLLEWESGYGESARPTGCLIDKNHIYNNQTGSAQTFGIQGDDTCFITNNIIEKAAGVTTGNLISVSNSADNPKIYHNTGIQRTGSTDWVISITGTSTATIKNNIFRDISSNCCINISTGSSATLSNNRYSGGAAGTAFYATVSGTEYFTATFADYLTAVSEANGTLGSPTFVNEASDYHLQSSSLCRNAGADLDIADDYDNVARGNTPDIGAYERRVIYYVDATTGNDSDSGETTDLAWQTITKVNGSTFKPGDQVLFKRGETWAVKLVPPSSGSSDLNIVFGAYGSGNRPLISTPSGGTDCIDISSKSYITVKDIDCTGAGATNWKSGVVVDANSHHIYLENIESYSNNYYGFHINQSNYVTVTNCIGRNNVEGINFRNGATYGVINGGSYYSNSSKNVLCEGGGEITATGVTAYSSGYESFHVRYANSKITAIGCLSYDAGTVDATAGVAYNAREGGYLTLINCIGYSNTRYSVQSWDGASNVVVAYHCTFYNDKYAVNIATGTFTMKNCALSTFGWGDAIYISAGVTATLDYNVYHSGNWYWKGTDYSNVADYRSASGQDSNCIVDNPDFVTPGSNFHLQSSSPCRNAGVDLDITTDYGDVVRDDTPDIGAYEFIYATYYVDATNGSDSNPGTYAKPWKTISKVNSSTFLPGDTILFKRGETWAEMLTPPSSGSVGLHIVFADYGSGALPVINGSALNHSLSIPDATVHHLTFQNIKFAGATGASRQTCRVYTHDVSMVGCEITGSAAYIGFSAWSVSGADIYNIVLDTCLIYSNYASGVFIGSDTGVSGPYDCYVQNCTAYSNGTSDTLDHGIYVKYGVTVKNCIVYSNKASGIQVENNSVVGNFAPVLDSCKSYSNNRGYIVQHNGVLMKNCIAYANTKENLFMSANRTKGCTFYHNTFVNSLSMPCMRYDGTCATDALNTFKNNIICQDIAVFDERCFRTDVVADLAHHNTWDYNSYYQDGTAGANITASTTLAQWQALTGSPDAHSIIASPAFVAPYTDLHLQPSSPCRGTGVNLYIPTDYAGAIRDSAPDIGVYECAPVTYYVDATKGSDSNSGLTPHLAWQTITKVNSSTFKPGDQVLFKRGETWATGGNRNLIPPSSGVSGLPIIFGAYGSGALPVINSGGSGSPALLLNKDYVIAEYLDLQDNADYCVRIKGGSYCILRNCTVHGGGSNWGCISVSDDGSVTTAHNEISNNTVYSAAHEGIYVKNNTAFHGVSDTLIENNVIYSVSNECIQNSFSAPATIGATNTTIRGNTVYDPGTDVGHMQLMGSGLVIEKNKVYSTGAMTTNYGGIFIENADDVLVVNNLIYNMAFNNANSVGGIYLASTVTNCIMYHNTIYGVTNAGAGTGYGIYCNNGGSGGNFSNNCIDNCDDQMRWYGTAPTATYNAVHGTCTNTGTNPVTDDPVFVTPGSNFHLQSSSPCRNAGKCHSGFDLDLDFDYDGVSRYGIPDIGAYEFV